MTTEEKIDKILDKVTKIEISQGIHKEKFRTTDEAIFNIKKQNEACEKDRNFFKGGSWVFRGIVVFGLGLIEYFHLKK